MISKVRLLCSILFSFVFITSNYAAAIQDTRQSYLNVYSVILDLNNLDVLINQSSTDTTSLEIFLPKSDHSLSEIINYTFDAKTGVLRLTPVTDSKVLSKSVRGSVKITLGRVVKYFNITSQNSNIIFDDVKKKVKCVLTNGVLTINNGNLQNISLTSTDCKVEFNNAILTDGRLAVTGDTLIINKSQVSRLNLTTTSTAVTSLESKYFGLIFRAKSSNILFDKVSVSEMQRYYLTTSQCKLSLLQFDNTIKFGYAIKNKNDGTTTINGEKTAVKYDLNHYNENIIDISNTGSTVDIIM